MHWYPGLRGHDVHGRRPPLPPPSCYLAKLCNTQALFSLSGTPCTGDRYQSFSVFFPSVPVVLSGVWPCHHKGLSQQGFVRITFPKSSRLKMCYWEISFFPKDFVYFAILLSSMKIAVETSEASPYISFINDAGINRKTGKSWENHFTKKRSKWPISTWKVLGLISNQRYAN